MLANSFNWELDQKKLDTGGYVSNISSSGTDCTEYATDWNFEPDAFLNFFEQVRKEIENTAHIQNDG